MPKRKRSNWRRYYDIAVFQCQRPFGLRRLRVRKRSGRDGIAWDVLQQIKNEVLGEDVTCVELYPTEDRLVYDMNMRHLWEVPATAVPNLGH